MKKARNLLIVLLLCSAGCSGTGNINGSALLRTRGGEARTCAGMAVILLENRPETVKLVQKEFGAGDHGYKESWLDIIKVQYGPVIGTATCDAQGEFTFKNLSPGTYYVLTDVTWEVPNNGTQGGTLMQKIQLDRGQTKNIVLTE